MVQAKCVEKIRNNSGKIVGYIIEDFNNKRLNIRAEQLKQLIFTRQLNIVNLTLTSDGRLIDKSINSDIDDIEVLYNYINYEMCYIRDKNIVLNRLKEMLYRIYKCNIELVACSRNNEEGYIFIANNNLICFDNKLKRLIDINMKYTDGEEALSDKNIDIFKNAINDSIKNTNNVNMYNIFKFAATVLKNTVEEKVSIVKKEIYISNCGKYITFTVKDADDMNNDIIIDGHWLHVCSELDDINNGMLDITNPKNLNKHLIKKFIEEFINNSYSG